MISGSRILFVIVRAHFVESRMKTFPPHPPVLLPLRFAEEEKEATTLYVPLASWAGRERSHGAVGRRVDWLPSVVARSGFPWPRTGWKFNFLTSQSSIFLRPFEARDSTRRKSPTINSEPRGMGRA
jgi:hypothetical protein